MKKQFAKLSLLALSIGLFMAACSNKDNPQENQLTDTETAELNQISTDNKIDIIDRENANRVIPMIEENETTQFEETDADEASTQEGQETPNSEENQTEETNQEEKTEETSQAPSQASPKELKILDESIYDVELMEIYHKNNIDMSQYESVDQVIDTILNEYGADRSTIGISFYNFLTDEHYYHNEDQLIVAASTAKIPVVMAYIDLINAGHYSYETQLLYNDYYYVEGNGNIANSPSQLSYSIADLMHEAIVYSDNTAWYTLVFNYPNNFGGIASYILDKTGYYNVPEYFWMDNYATAYLFEQLLIEVATNPDYEYLVELMKQTDPPQLFTSYINTEVFANKFGRVDEEINDMGIYYENDQPQYILTTFTSGLSYADNILEDLNLYVNLWFRQNYILN